MKTLVSKFFKDESGATAIEYGLIAALIAVVIIVAVTALGGQLETTFENIEAGLETGNSAAPS
jgi:pilus assembly protein Flp/PilA